MFHAVGAGIEMPQRLGKEPEKAPDKNLKQPQMSRVCVSEESVWPLVILRLGKPLRTGELLGAS